MPWYAAGTITVAASGTTATGTGTAFLGNVRVGDGIAIQGSSSLHEVTGVTSDTQLTFAPPYAGAAGGGKAYRVAPVLGYDKDLSDAFNALRLQFGDQLSSLSPWATAATGGEAMDELGFGAAGKAVVAAVTQEDGLDALGFGATGKDLAGAAGAGEAREVMELGTSALQDEDYFARGNGVTTDLDSTTIPGMYSYPDSAAGAPDPRNGALIVVGSTDSDIIQLASSVAGDLWLRRADTGAYPTWGPWRCITGVGVGQSWVDLTASRALGTTYTNTTGRTIVVSVTCYAAAGVVQPHITGIVESSVVGEVLAQSTGAPARLNIQLTVPAGSTYRVNTSGDSNYQGVLTYWMELR